MKYKEKAKLITAITHTLLTDKKINACEPLQKLCIEKLELLIGSITPEDAKVSY
jgi:hypothetical protein